ncbi:MAG: RpiR family transcriptional regulator, partial [Acidobacteriota bacterium]|nr:RpiR family transcriptional regulator [Acidobacteriota bacterium]
QLEDLNAEPVALPPASRSGSARDSRHLFSDLNQWMLKVLLAPELPEHLLSAPRGRYLNASQLAKAAQVSVMSAFRFVQQLQDEGYLHESSSSLELVRRPDLFARWQASNDRSCREIDMRFRLPGDASVRLRKVLNSGRACLALFAAADALHLGFVQGVAPHVYVERVQPSSLMQWKNLRPCEGGEPPDVVLRQAAVPQSVFRGMVKADGAAASDVIQVWLDVAAHPARGLEQANLIRQRVVEPIIHKGK